MSFDIWFDRNMSDWLSKPRHPILINLISKDANMVVSRYLDIAVPKIYFLTVSVDIQRECDEN